MRKKKILTLIVTILLLPHFSFAQKNKRARQTPSPDQEISYNDKNYLKEIQSVQFYNTEKEQSLPILRLGTNETLYLSFDDLRADVRNYYVSIEHCNSNWEKSNLSLLEYSSGYGEDQIRERFQSQNTLKAYTNYHLKFPTQNTRPLISGNYLLKVYENADPNRLVITRRFYVLDDKVNIAADIGRPMDIKYRNSHQKIDLTVNTHSLLVNNPHQDIKVLAMQNQRPDMQLWSNNPSGIAENELTYKQINSLLFPGGQEFLYTDLRSFQLQSASIKRLASDTTIKIELFPDKYLDNLTYNEATDNNGLFYIRNLDHTGQVEIIADYAEVSFELISKRPYESDIYLLGAFNNFHKDSDSRLRYDSESKSWKIKKLLKQGVYDYLYAAESAPNFYETKNTYQIFVYYKNPRLNRDEIVGFLEINSPL